MASVREIDQKTVLPTSAEISKAPKGRRMMDEPVVAFSFDEAADRLNAAVGFVKKSASEKPKPPGAVHRIAVMPCLHVPFHSEKNMVRAVEWAKSERAETLIVAGDMLDCLSMGHAGYRRNIRPKHFVSLKEELATGKIILQYFSQQFKRVVLMSGNHGDRVRKWFAERVGPEMMFLISHDVIKLLASDFANVEYVETKDPNGNEIHWIYQVGDCRIVHAEVGSSIEMRPTVRVDQWFEQWDDYLRLVPYNVLVECHTHQGGIIPLNDGAKQLVEAMCLTREPQYALEPQIKYRHPQVNGITLLEQIGGVTDMNKTRQHIFKGME